MITQLAEADADGAATRRALYDGALLLVHATPASLAYADAVEEILAAELAAEGDPRRVQFRLSNEEFLARFARVRSVLATPPRFLRHVAAVLESLHLEPAAFAADVPRLRAIPHDGHLIPAARPAYSAHRDTWFANPLAQLNVWMPLHDVGEGETFGFYEACWARAVPNDSDRFDYDTWKERVGWQRPGRAADAVYPTVLGSPPLGPRTPFAAARGDLLLFAAAHLHEPAHNTSGRTRLSVDFRIVHLDDHARGIAAPHTDERSRGSTLSDYHRLAELLP